MKSKLIFFLCLMKISSTTTTTFDIKPIYKKGIHFLCIPFSEYCQKIIRREESKTINTVK